MGRPSIIEPEPRPLPDEELVAKLFRTLGDATRLKILQLLLERPRYQKELVAAVGLSQSKMASNESITLYRALKVNWMKITNVTRLRVGDSIIYPGSSASLPVED